MIGINGKTWNELKVSDLQALFEGKTDEDSFFDESVFYEFKSDQETNAKLAKEICAFSNTFGGYIFLGINDDHSIGGCEHWNEQRIHATVFDSITPTPQIDVKRFTIKGCTIFVIKVEEGSIPPYITNEGKIHCRLSSGSFPIKDATHMARLIEKRRDTMHMISDKIELHPIEIGYETPANLCAYIDVGFATTLTESSDSQYERFNCLNYDGITSILKRVSSDFGISRVGSSLFFTIGNMTGKRDDGTIQILGAGIQFYMEIMLDGSVKYRMPLCYDANSKKNSCNITFISTIAGAFADIYEYIFGKSFADLFVYAYKYQKLTVLKQFRPYYYLGEQNDPEIVQKIRAVEKLQKEKYGDNLIVEGNRIPPNKYTLIDRHYLNKFKVPYNSQELIMALFTNAYQDLGFVENPFKNEEAE